MKDRIGAILGLAVGLTAFNFTVKTYAEHIGMQVNSHPLQSAIELQDDSIINVSDNLDDGTLVTYSIITEKLTSLPFVDYWTITESIWIRIDDKVIAVRDYDMDGEPEEVQVLRKCDDYDPILSILVRPSGRIVVDGYLGGLSAEEWLELGEQYWDEAEDSFVEDYRKDEFGYEIWEL